MPENTKLLHKLEKGLRAQCDESSISIGETAMVDAAKWTTSSLYSALCEDPLFSGDKATIEVIGGVEATLHLVMHEFGDLPLYLTVVGDQIIVDAVLWSLDEVSDVAGFNDTVLRTHKYFPLSTISLDSFDDDKDYYQMFGALSATSILANVIFEIEMLASNVIQATEAYSNYLSIPVDA